MFRWYTLDKILHYMSNSIILGEDLFRWKRDFEIFSIDHYTSDIAKKKNVVSEFLDQCHPPYTMRVSSHRVLYL